MPSADQSAASRMSLVVTPAPAADEHDAPLTECALKFEMSNGLVKFPRSVLFFEKPTFVNTTMR